MPVAEVIESRSIEDVTDNSSADLIYKVWDTTDSIVAHNTLVSAAPTSVVVGSKTLVRRALRMVPDPTADHVWIGTAQYIENTKPQIRPTPQTGDSAWSFDVTGETFRLTQSLQTTRYPATGFVLNDVPDFMGAINVQDDKVEGVDILIPSTKYSETHFLPVAQVTQAYVDGLSQVVGKTNNAIFRGFGIDRLLCLRAAGSRRGNEDWQVNFDFAIGSHVTGQSLGGGFSANVGKNAHEFLWVLYEQKEDTTAKRIRKTPIGAYAEKVYESTDFSALGIGT